MRVVGVRAPIISCAIAVAHRRDRGSTTYRTREDQMFGLLERVMRKGVTIKNGQWKQKKEQGRRGLGPRGGHEYVSLTLTKR